MTEYEIADLALSNAEAIRSQIALMQEQSLVNNTRLNLFYTFLFGYLITAYVVGAALTKIQVSLLNLLYLVAILINRRMYYLGLQQHQELKNGLRQLQDVPSPPPLTNYGFEFVIITSIIMILVSLFFMWSVRHPKTE
jgi:hypothetical protein